MVSVAVVVAGLIVNRVMGEGMELAFIRPS